MESTEFDEALELGQELLHRLETGRGEAIEVARLEHGSVRLSIHPAGATAELTLTADEARWLAFQLQGSGSDSRPDTGV